MVQGRLKPRDAERMYVQLRELINRGTPLLESIRLMRRARQPAGVEEVLSQLERAAVRGIGFADLNMELDRPLGRGNIEMLGAAAEMGRLPEGLQLAASIERARIIQRRRWLMPLVNLVCVSVFVTLLPWVLPSASENAGPLLGAVDSVLSLLRVISISILLMVTIAWSVGKLSTRIVVLADVLSWVAWHSPVVNEWIRGLDKIRALWILARALEAGTTLFKALAMARLSQGNVVAMELFCRAERDVETGEPLSSALERTNMLTAIEVASIRAGEVSGNLPLSLTSVAKIAEENWERRTRNVVGAALMLPYTLFVAPWFLLVLALVASF